MPQTLYDDLASGRDRDLEIMNNIKEMNSKVHRAISSAQKIDNVLEEAQNTPFTQRISGANMRHVDKFRLLMYNGKTDQCVI